VLTISVSTDAATPTSGAKRVRSGQRYAKASVNEKEDRDLKKKRLTTTGKSKRRFFQFKI